MTWFKVDDGFWSHPKTSTLSDAAVTLWVRAGAYCCQHLTDGFVKKPAIRLLGDVEAVNELVDAELWHSIDGGWVFHDWDEYQETSETVKKRRDAARDRQRRAREARENKRNESQRESRVTDDVTNGVSSLPPTRPDPTRPDPTLKKLLAKFLQRVVTKGGYLTCAQAKTNHRPLDAPSTSTTPPTGHAGHAVSLVKPGQHGSLTQSAVQPRGDLRTRKPLP